MLINSQLPPNVLDFTNDFKLFKNKLTTTITTLEIYLHTLLCFYQIFKSFEVFKSIRFLFEQGYPHTS